MRFVTRFSILLAFFLMVQCSSDNTVNNPPGGGAPTVTSITPDSLSRGEGVVTITVRGTNFILPTSISMGAGIQVHGFRTISSTQLEVDISVDRNTSPGTRSIFFIAQGGSVTSPALFTVLSNQTPIAAFNVSPNNPDENDTLVFDASSSTDDGRITEYNWTFDGGTATGKIVTRKLSAGTHEVKLTVKDNNGTTSSRKKDVEVKAFTETVCTNKSPNRGLLYGTVIAVEPGNNAIVKLDNPGTCANSFYLCGDMRDAFVDLGFFGIISEMTDLGDRTFRIKNSCPFRWPPRIGHRVFLFYKRCDNNFCT